MHFICELSQLQYLLHYIQSLSLDLSPECALIVSGLNMCTENRLHLWILWWPLCQWFSKSYLSSYIRTVPRQISMSSVFIYMEDEKTSVLLYSFGPGDVFVACCGQSWVADVCYRPTVLSLAWMHQTATRRHIPDVISVARTWNLIHSVYKFYKPFFCTSVLSIFYLSYFIGFPIEPLLFDSFFTYFNLLMIRCCGTISVNISELCI